MFYVTAIAVNGMPRLSSELYSYIYRMNLVTSVLCRRSPSDRLTFCEDEHTRYESQLERANEKRYRHRKLENRSTLTSLSTR